MAEGFDIENPQANIIAVYHRLGEKFGWTPEQIDRMDYTFVEGLLIYDLYNTKKRAEKGDLTVR